jgi:hypothetical protein
VQARGVDVSEYCRAIETYLCQKNDGHLIRVVGPSFEVVSRWATGGVPLKVAFAGIDRSVERYHRKGPSRRRPMRIDFCEADVLDVFDEWRRATGVTRVASAGADPSVPRKGPSLPEHLERVVLSLTNARATGSLGGAVDPIIDDLSRELDRARAQAGGIRGEARRGAIERLAAANAALMDCVVGTLTDEARSAFEREAVQQLAAYRDSMSPDAFSRARQAAVHHLIRTRLGLPTIVFG